MVVELRFAVVSYFNPDYFPPDLFSKIWPLVPLYMYLIFELTNDNTEFSRKFSFKNKETKLQRKHPHLISRSFFSYNKIWHFTSI